MLLGMVFGGAKVMRADDATFQGSNRFMAEETFRLPNSSYEELVKIIRAYGSAGAEASLDEVATRAAMNKTIISRNNAFLMSVGIIAGGKAKAISEKGRKLSNALQFQIADEIASCWRDVATGNEFLQKMVTAVAIRQGMEDSALQSHIAYSAGESRTPHVMAGAGAVVEILKTAGLLKEEDGKLTAVSDWAQERSASVRESVKEPEQPAPSLSHVAGVSLPASSVGVSIQIQIQCSASEVSELGPRSLSENC